MAASTLRFLAHGAKRINGLLKPPNSFQPLLHRSRNRGLAGPGTWAGARVGGMGARPEEGQLVPMASGKSLQTEEGRPAEAGTGAFPEPRGPQGCSQGQGEVFGSDSKGTGTAGRLWAEAPSGWEWAEPAKGEVSRGWMWGDLGQPGPLEQPLWPGPRWGRWTARRSPNDGAKLGAELGAELGGICPKLVGSPQRDLAALGSGAGTWPTLPLPPMWGWHWGCSVTAPETQAREHSPAQPSVGSELSPSTRATSRCHGPLG